MIIYYAIIFLGERLPEFRTVQQPDEQEQIQHRYIAFAAISSIYLYIVNIYISIHLKNCKTEMSSKSVKQIGNVSCAGNF